MCPGTNTLLSSRSACVGLTDKHTPYVGRAASWWNANLLRSKVTFVSIPHIPQINFFFFSPSHTHTHGHRVDVLILNCGRSVSNIQSLHMTRAPLITKLVWNARGWKDTTRQQSHGSYSTWFDSRNPSRSHWALHNLILLNPSCLGCTMDVCRNMIKPFLDRRLYTFVHVQLAQRWMSQLYPK